jgi:hypothetical protein
MYNNQMHQDLQKKLQSIKQSFTARWSDISERHKQLMKQVHKLQNETKLNNLRKNINDKLNGKTD